MEKRTTTSSSRGCWLLVCCLFLTSTALAAEPKPSPRPSSWAIPMTIPGLKNFYKVDERLYRGAQPDAAGMKRLAGMGIRSILNLREFHTDLQEADQGPLSLYQVPMDAGHIKEDDIISALKIIRDAPGPLYVHCWHGSDRTGTVVAMYRMIFQEWPRRAAIDELVNGGYGYHAIYPNIITYLENVDLSKIRQRLEMQALP